MWYSSRERVFIVQTFLKDPVFQVESYSEIHNDTYDNIYCNKVHKTRFTQKAKVSLQTRWTLLVIIQ